ncbi:MAG: hypothetical protein JNM07_08230 [Phycisphaerae bacterium]|nr:hypothetical protein [Phycisphaerae bacterium]
MSRASPMALRITAVLLAVLVLTEVGRRLASGAPDVAAQINDLAAVTVDDGAAEDLIFTLDGRSEVLLVYRVRNQQSLELVGREDLRQMFLDARRAAGGAPIEPGERGKVIDRGR